MDAGRRFKTSEYENHESVKPCRNRTGSPSCRPLSATCNSTPVLSCTRCIWTLTSCASAFAADTSDAASMTIPFRTKPRVRDKIFPLSLAYAENADEVPQPQGVKRLTVDQRVTQALHDRRQQDELLAVSQQNDWPATVNVSRAKLKATDSPVLALAKEVTTTSPSS